MGKKKEKFLNKIILFKQVLLTYEILLEIDNYKCKYKTKYKTI